MTKIELIDKTEKWLVDNQLSVSFKDLDRPWGAFWHISPDSLNNFLKLFFPDFNPGNQFISPKILLVEPGKRLSLQIHHKRSERWHIIDGPVKIVLNKDELIIESGKTITIKTEEIHRLCGLDQAGVVAEIWIHHDPLDPSTEEDITRLADDFTRN
ncbi:MAG: phosphoheptose isomerase [Candidatus Shapirobacteria bacterium]|nr:phosphoheptose isomerase [Candidatus Shapirobacteria bacterium]MDD4410261.1 phosphoheptose isomerase [Candidatus Shapirobacteria bacterium]